MFTKSSYTTQGLKFRITTVLFLSPEVKQEEISFMLERNQGIQAYFSSSFTSKHSLDINKCSPLIWQRNIAPSILGLCLGLNKEGKTAPNLGGDRDSPDL